MLFQKSLIGREPHMYGSGNREMQTKHDIGPIKYHYYLKLTLKNVCVYTVQPCFLHEPQSQ